LRRINSFFYYLESTPIDASTVGLSGLWAAVAFADVRILAREQALFDRASRPHSLLGRHGNVLLNIPGFGLGEPNRFLCGPDYLHGM
jgi:hypothetical protein